MQKGYTRYKNFHYPLGHVQVYTFACMCVHIAETAFEFPCYSCHLQHIGYIERVIFTNLQFDVRGHQWMVFSTGGSVICYGLLTLILARSDSFKLNCPMGLFLTNMLFFASQDHGLELYDLWIVVMFLLAVWMAPFWRHPFTAECPLVRKWCNAQFLQTCWSNAETHSTTSWIAWELIVSVNFDLKFQQNFHWMFFFFAGKSHEKFNNNDNIYNEIYSVHLYFDLVFNHLWGWTWSIKS